MSDNKHLDRLTPVPLGTWSFGGKLGHRIDRILERRITSEFARDAIHPELLETFRARVDDVIRPDYGMWQGEFWGKWVLSAIGAARYTQDDALRSLICDSVDQVLATQDDDGYLGTYQNPDFIIPPGEQGMNWNIWGRKYVLWGLIEAWRLLEDPRILEGAAGLVDHLLTQVGPGRTDLIRTGAMFGLPSTSILTPVVMLYEATEEPRYLDFAEYIVEQWARHPAGPPDILHKGLSNAPVHTWFPEPYRWAKSYEFISCVEGLLHLYRITGRGVYLDAVAHIYEHLRTWERSPVGSISFNDKFVGSSRLINIAGEICDVVYWNRLSFELLRLTHETVYADEFERSLYNALLTGMNPEGTWGLRRLRLSHEHVPAHHHCDLAHQQCCVANAPRGLLQAAQMAWMTDPEGVLCTLYSQGRGSVPLPSGRSADVRIEGEYPAGGIVRIILKPASPEAFRLRLRVPAWSKNTTVSINGEPAAEAAPGGWFDVHRTWRSENEIVLNLDTRTHFAHFDASALSKDDPLVTWSVEAWAKLKNMEPGAPPSPVTEADALPHRDAVALMRGPLVLARDVRLGDADIYEPLPSEIDLENPPPLAPIVSPADIFWAFETRDGPKLRVCDFASAGNTWDANSCFNTWFILDNTHD
jgi:hypothetical protein